ncbi:MAG: glycosyltransferase [Desulfovibrionaceae bacterium]|nr:glycosyltransferase [Desulfovibrionaceae bacterium]
MSSEKKLVSVIIPAYQHEAYIRECIESILAQTYPAIELILIDDASTDNTFRIAENMRERCEARFTRTIIMSKEKGCAAASCNMGITLARGEYIYLIASDDAALPHAVETLAAILDSDTHCVLAVGDNAFFNETSTTIGWDREWHSTSVEHAVFRTFGDVLGLNADGHIRDNFGRYPELLWNNHIPNGYLMRRSALLQAGGYNEKVLVEDWYMNLQLSKLGTMCYVPEVLFRYRWHSKNTIKKYQSPRAQYNIYRQICKIEREYALAHGYAELLSCRDPGSMKNRISTLKCYLGKARRCFFHIHHGRRRTIIRVCGIPVWFRKHRTT